MRRTAVRSGAIAIVAFSLELALSITGVGLAAVLARSAVRAAELRRLLTRALPAVSAAVIVVAGLAMTVRAVPKVQL